MFPRLQLAMACSLVASASGLVLLWALLLAMSYSAQSGLMPWVAAGIVLYGWVLVVLAAIVGVPGILWASHVADRVSPALGRVAVTARRIGTGALTIGLAAAVAVPIAEQLRPKNPHDGCVIYRTEAASAALAAAGASAPNDCPAK